MSLTDTSNHYHKRFLPPKNLNTTFDYSHTSLPQDNDLIERSEIPLDELSFGKFLFRSSEGYNISLRYSQCIGLCIWVDINKSMICYISVPNTGIKAVNLQISSNVPGSLTSMHTSLLLEACQPLNITAFPHMSSRARTSHKLLPNKNFYILKIRSDLKYAGDIHKILVGLKGPDNVEQKKSSLFQEGLPYWAAYIPSYAYSFQLRTLLQLIIAIYTYFNIILAVWQLYRHVDLIHDSIRPFVELFDYYLQHTAVRIKYVFNLFAQFWWDVLKPILLLYYNYEVFIRIFAIFKPLFLHFDIAISCFYCIGKILFEILNPIWYVFTPVLRLLLVIGGQFWNLKIILFPFKSILSFIWQTLRVFNTYSPTIEIVVRNSMRSLFMNSIKTIFLGIFYAFQRVWYSFREKFDQRENAKKQL
ncbi:hypothetical protein LOD99_14809 [Oopsacas minuta]|uniref:Uncharacterized protein n=1 Tax=Oopsacas minuta TaxID=111878 RepID=A0AAV7KD36_9METZ|nr:hypothetical protein LOD99_14809 [Oopsacas minuta]